MASKFQYVAEGNERGIVKLHALQMQWEKTAKLPEPANCQGDTYKQISFLLRVYPAAENRITTLFEKTIQFLEAVDENFKLADESEARALARNASVKAMHDELSAVTQSVSSMINGTKGGGLITAGVKVVSKVKDIYYKAKENYEEHGRVYDVIQYGKCAIKIGKGIVKIAGSVASIATGVGVPIAVAGIISAGNDIINGMTDAAYVYNDLYDSVGTSNYLKDTLVKNGGELGSMLGNEKAGETFGKLAYYGLDVVSFLNGADKMLKSFGKVNTELTGTAGYSFVWGRTSWSDVMDNEFSKLSIKELIRSKFMDANSTGNFCIEAIENTVSVFKKASKVGTEIADLIFN